MVFENSADLRTRRASKSFVKKRPRSWSRLRCILTTRLACYFTMLFYKPNISLAFNVLTQQVVALWNRYLLTMYLHTHRNSKSFLMQFSSIAGLKVVILTTFRANNNANFIKMTTFPFQCSFVDLFLANRSRGRLNIKMLSYQHRNPPVILRLPDVHNMIFDTATYLRYWTVLGVSIQSETPSYKYRDF